MVHAKKYETVSKSVKAMQRKLWPLLLDTESKYFESLT